MLHCIFNWQKGTVLKLQASIIKHLQYTIKSLYK